MGARLRCALVIGAFCGLVGPLTGEIYTHTSPDSPPNQGGIDAAESTGPTSIIFVEDDAPPGGDGTTWATAFTYLQDALAAARAGHEIRIAQGVYRPDRDEGGQVIVGDRTAAFKLINGVTIAGGYRGIDPAYPGDPDDRDIAQFETVLSGDLAGDDGSDGENSSENSYHVFYHPAGLGLTGTAVLHGVTIRDAYANGPSALGHDAGAGMYNNENSPTVSHCIFRQNWATGGGGGGMHNRNCAPTVSHCTFTDNYGFDGGGMRNLIAQPVITHCLFAGNEAGDGGAMSNYESQVTIADSMFRDNNAVSAGAIDDFKGQLRIARCEFERNRATYEYAPGGGAILLYESHAEVTDSRFVENSAPLGGGVAFTQGSKGKVLGSVFERNVAEWPAYGGDGGAIAIDYGDGVSVIDSEFYENRCDGDGGAIANYDAPSTVLNCRFGENRGVWGGAVFDSRSPTLLANNSFSGNVADYGAAVFVYESHANLSQCTVHGNSAVYDAGGIYLSRSEPVIANSILWGNRDWAGIGETTQIYNALNPDPNWHPRFSCIQGLDSFAGHGNIGQNPRLVSPLGEDGIVGTQDDDLGLLPGSPCIDAGDNAAVRRDQADLDSDGQTLEPLPIDLAASPRFLDDPCMADTGQSDPEFGGLGIVDLGAFERPSDGEADPDADGLSNCTDNCPTQSNANQADCNSDGVGDACVFAYCFDDPVCADCNENGVPDACDISDGHADSDGNGKPDSCQRVWHVDDDAPPNGDGMSWPTAFRFLQDAMHVAELGDEIRIAGGTYHPDLDEGGVETYGSRNSTFRLIDGAALVGGHRGCPGGGCAGGDPDEIDRLAYESVLNGIVAHDDPANDSWCLHVVTAIGTGPATLLAGVTVRNGYANLSYSWPDDRGAGMFIYGGGPTIDDCTITNNYTDVGGVGGVWTYRSAPLIRNSTFRRNFGWERGGALGNDYSNPTLINCVFEENDALEGGAIFNSFGASTIVDCTFRFNSATYGGGALYDHDSNTTMQGCLINQNRTDRTFYASGGGIYSYGSNTILENCVISRNSAFGFNSSYGGGVYAGYRSNFSMNRCLVAGNTAKFGGGIGAYGLSFTAVNSVIAGNRATDAGGAIDLSLPAGSFVHTTFAANTAPNGANLHYSEGQTWPANLVGFDHCILQDSGNETWMDDTPQPVIRYSAVDDDLPLNGMVYPGPGNIDELAVFVREPADGGDGFGDDPATTEVDESENDDYGDLRLEFGSAGIDDGDPDFGAEPNQTDLDGHPRVLCGLVDMGAYERGIGDHDCNGAMDLADFSMWEECMAGPAEGPYPPGCEAFDVDADGDVDLKDYAGLMSLLNP